MQICATAPGMKTSAAYLEITNKGALDDRLIVAQAAIAERVEIHSMEMDGGVMRMRAVDGGLEIAVGDSVDASPGRFAYHVDGLDHRFARRQSA